MRAYIPGHDQPMIGAVNDQRLCPDRLAHFGVSGRIVVRICRTGNEERRPSFVYDTIAYVAEPEQRGDPDGINFSGKLLSLQLRTERASRVTSQ